MSAITKFLIPIAVCLGPTIVQKLLPKVSPIVVAVDVSIDLLKIADEYVDDSAAKSVMEIYRNKDGSYPPMVLLTEYGPSKDSFKGKPIGKQELQKWVDKHGGTAWIQVGANGRSMAWWHPSKTFKTKDPSKPLSHKLSVGEVVRGSKDAK